MSKRKKTKPSDVSWGCPHKHWKLHYRGNKYWIQCTLCGYRKYLDEQEGKEMLETFNGLRGYDGK